MAVKKEKATPADKPAALREGWRVVRFDEMAELVNDRVDNPAEAGVERYVGLEHLDPESLKIRRWGAPTDVEAQKLRFRPGDIIFGKRRAYQRKLAVADFEGICSAHAMVLRAREEKIIKEFLPFFMQSDTFFDRALSISVGSLSPTINWKTLASQQFAIPPKDEQHRIAEILWAANNSRESYTNALERLELYESAIVFECVSKASRDEIALRELSEVSYGLTINASRREMPHTVPYLRVANVMRGWLNLKEVKTIGCTPEDITRYSLEDGDVLVVEGHANVDEIARAALWRSEINKCLHQNHILRVRCGENLIPRFLVAYLNSPKAKSYFKLHAKSTSGLNTINSTVLREIKIPLFSKNEQRSAIDTLQRLEKNRQLLTSHILLQASLQKILLEHLL